MFATAFHKTGISGNMVFTDLAASMALVQLRQEREEREHNRVNSIAAGDRPYAGKQGEWDHPCSPIDFDDPEQQTKTQAYADCCYYMKYALAAYGWPLLMLMHIGTGLCRMVPDCRCCACCRTHRTPDDDCLECNTSAVLYQTGLSRDDIIHITCHNKAYRPPFFVSVDRTKRAVVVSIRGTLSISDALTDVTAEAVSFEHTAGTLHAHRGIFKAAKYVKTQVEQHNSGESCILDRAFEYAKEVDPNGDYKLVVVGHSLGGGTASILSLLFVLERSYPGLLCFAYSPPGGLLSLPAVEITKEFTTSVVLGKDLIPRLSLEKTYQLLNNMMAETQRTLSPKWLIQLKCFCACCCRCQSCQRDETIEREKESEAPHGDNANGTGYCMAEGRLACPPLYTPGNIIYITAFPEDKKSYRAYWTDYKEFHTVFVGAAMVGDHLAHNVYDALQALNPDKDV
ncbi:diacylglycerol lipase-alpha-like [Corticium candelabrum]|uniref:diacylglycerol lipase-alpha-like n=1 Tax=Corticium candelabrum TaxID=121492 RepID=UPI002E25FB25|nr:diacylglycerol lipase-alpha-like [Corticium candelabrum]